MSPPITSNLILHLDARSLTLDDEDPVTQWDDLSPSGLVLVPGSFTPPTYVNPSTLPTGLPGVAFPSNNTALEDTSSVSLVGPRTVYFVARMPDGDGNWRYMHPQGANFLIVKSPSNGWLFGHDGFSTIGPTDAVLGGTNAYVTFLHQTSSAEVRINGTTRATGSLASAAAITTIRFGNVGGSAGSGGTFLIHEFLMYGEIHDSDDIASIENYLYQRWFTGLPDAMLGWDKLASRRLVSKRLTPYGA